MPGSKGLLPRPPTKLYRARRCRVRRGNVGRCPAGGAAVSRLPIARCRLTEAFDLAALGKWQIGLRTGSLIGRKSIGKGACTRLSDATFDSVLDAQARGLRHRPTLPADPRLCRSRPPGGEETVAVTDEITCSCDNGFRPAYLRIRQLLTELEHDRDGHARHKGQ